MHPSNSAFSKIRVETDRDVTAFSAFKTPAKSAYFLEIRSKEDMPLLSEAVSAAKSSELPVAFLGDGTNCLFAFDRFPGLLVRNALSGRRFQNGEDVERGIGSASRFTVCSAEKVHPFAFEMAKAGDNALLPWIGLPGSFGGAVVGNAGCFGLETADVFVSAEVWNVAKARMENLLSQDMGFAYRTSVLKNATDRFVVSASFDLSRRKPGNAFEAMDVEAFRELRRTKQPAGRTCGSFFKNPEGHSAGALIDRAGLK